MSLYLVIVSRLSLQIDDACRHCVNVYNIVITLITDNIFSSIKEHDVYCRPWQGDEWSVFRWQCTAKGIYGMKSKESYR